VHEQYPIEIIDKRRQLVPMMKDARGKGHEAVLKEDGLYIDKRRFYPLYHLIFYTFFPLYFVIYEYPFATFDISRSSSFVSTNIIIL
jgi:hypothetical protein